MWSKLQTYFFFVSHYPASHYMKFDGTVPETLKPKLDIRLSTVRQLTPRIALMSHIWKPFSTKNESCSSLMSREGLPLCPLRRNDALYLFKLFTIWTTILYALPIMTMMPWLYSLLFFEHSTITLWLNHLITVNYSKPVSISVELQ